MGIMNIDSNVTVEIHCDGLNYGLHGYRHTKCTGWGNSNKTSVNFIFALAEKEARQILPEYLAPGWFYGRGNFVCPECIKESVANGGPEAWTEETASRRPE